MSDKTTIQINADTRNQLRRYKAEYGDTYDEAIKRLMDENDHLKYELGE